VEHGSRGSSCWETGGKRGIRGMRGERKNSTLSTAMKVLSGFGVPIQREKKVREKRMEKRQCPQRSLGNFFREIQKPGR